VRALLWLIVAGYAALWVAGLVGLVLYWDDLNDIHVAGVAAIALAMGALLFLGMARETAARCLAEGATIEDVVPWLLSRAGWVTALLGTFLFVVWLLVFFSHRVLGPVLPEGVAWLVFLLLFLGAVRGLLAAAHWLRTRGPWGD
jgi:hypothetical protein